LLDTVTLGDVNGHDTAVVRSSDAVFHLHGLKDQKSLACRDLIACGDEHIEHTTGHGCREASLFLRRSGPGFDDLNPMDATVDVHPDHVPDAGSVGERNRIALAHLPATVGHRCDLDSVHEPPLSSGKRMHLMHVISRAKVNHHGYLLLSERKGLVGPEGPSSSARVRPRLEASTAASAITASEAG
jgi:hypothetical protein